jgi:hypothetical protein
VKTSTLHRSDFVQQNAANTKTDILLLDDMIKNSLALLFVNQVVMLHYLTFINLTLNLVVILHLSSKEVMISSN